MKELLAALIIYDYGKNDINLSNFYPTNRQIFHSDCLVTIFLRFGSYFISQNFRSKF